MEIRNESGDRDNFTMVPNFVYRLGMSPYAVALYGYIKQAAGEQGRCFKATKTIAEELNMSAGSVSGAKDELEHNGLIRIHEVKGPHGGKPLHSIAILDVWQRNAEFIQTHKKERSPYEQASSPSEIASSPSEIIKNPSIKNPNNSGDSKTESPPADKEKPTARSQTATKLPDSPRVVQAKREIKAILDGAGVLRPEVSSPRDSERLFVRRFKPMITAIFPNRGEISDDTTATKRIYRLRIDEEWLAERLTAYANGQGDEFRHPAKDGQEPNSFWVWKRLEKEWSIYRKEKADAEQREREQADYERRVAAALASVSPSEQDGRRAYPDSVHLHDPAGGPGGNVVCDAAGQAGIAVAAGGNVRVRRDGLGVLPMPQPPVGATDRPGEAPERGRSVREMYRDDQMRRHLATLDAEISKRKRASA